ncbi:NAD(P)/FAD-dependent oxidoreductase [Paenibacillus sp. 1001270B_150601_E10]|uniref:NAD(P)/FAD-dependent oxidoreductase n=1 Tax=Paenibacillus sp. 1001270B_150601_E10 TaxID=2787079 RepID=UPI00189E3752|nr:NAD(P)/FAD-dependent oxidoreductase [Paenibacillus sp. 1001270B_150601_E10]
MHRTQVVVVGGGPSGLMAAIAAAEQGASVTLVDKGNKLGRKLAISGGGRCNVTNNKPIDELIRFIPGNGRFLHSAFQHMNPERIIAFFERLGIALKEEDHGRMFPVSDKAKSVVDALIGEAVRLGVTLRINEPVEQVIYVDDAVKGVRLKSQEVLPADAVILATGGRSVPHTGSTGDGYPWAEAAGHTITELYPTEVPLTSNASFIRDKVLQGLSLRDIAITVWNEKGKKLITHEGDLIFTHFGLSGPAALRCSQFVVKELKRSKRETVPVTIDLKPELSLDAVSQWGLSVWSKEPKKAVKNIMKQMVPERMVPLLLAMVNMDDSTTHDHFQKKQWADLCELMKAFPMKISGTRSIEEAFVTGGGIHLKEINPKSMESKLTRGLFFCGEILDIHGYTGGYNITAAFATGYTAGHHAAQQ